MRTCPSCRRENADGARFCISCGTALTVCCTECGTEVPPEADFCPACGAPASPGPLPAGEERKVVTVLFADLVDWTGHGERLDPEDVRGLQLPYFERTRAEIERFGGTLEKFIGDAVMAVFGAPTVHEDDPERAVRAALAVRDAVAELNELADGADLHVRIGVNTGEAMVALGADPAAGEGLVTGDVVNTCSRLESSAPVDGILVGETTYRATATVVDYGEQREVDAKGKREPVLAWEAVGLREDAERPPTPLVGRWQELSHLSDALVRAREERTTQLVSLVGVPGIGKTRLARELVATIEAEPETASWRVGRCLPYGDGVSFAALAEMVRAEAGILTSDSSEEAATKLRAAVEALPGQADEHWLEAHLRPLVGLEGEAGERREDSFTAWRRFFEALAEQQPLVLVFEDLHWADPGVLDFVDYLVDWATGVPLLVLCTTRPELLERRPGWGGGKRNAITITLSPLSDEDTGQLVGALLGSGALPVSVARPLLARAGGNPLYAEEYVRMLVERGLLLRENGSWRLAQPDLPLPESVQGTIAARVDGLPPEEKALLQQAAVIGKVFWLGALGARSGAEAERLLHALERKEFVRRERRSSIADDVQYSFRHVLVRDVAYGQLPRARRAEAHVGAAVWLESLPGGREELAEELAHHYGLALELQRALGEESPELERRAATAFHRAGERALSLNAFGAADRFFVAELALRSNDDPERPNALLGLGWARAHSEGGGTAELTDAFDALYGVGRLEEATEVAAELAALFWSSGEPETADDYAGRAEALARDLPPVRAKAVALSRLASYSSVRDRAGEAIRDGSAALELAEALELDDVRARALTALGNARTQSGDRAALQDFERSIALSVAHRSTHAVTAYINYAGSQIAFGSLAEAFRLQAAGRTIAAELGEERLGAWLYAEQIMECYWTGRWDEAMRLAEEVSSAIVAATSYMEVPARITHGLIELDRADPAAAAAEADRALVRALEIGDFQVVLPAQAFRARVFLAQGDEGKAQALVESALAPLAGKEVWASYSWAALGFLLDALALPVPETTASTPWIDACRLFVDGQCVRAADLYAQIGARPEEARARLTAAAQLVAAGRREEAEAQLESAHAFYREVRASARLAEAEALLASA